MGECLENECKFPPKKKCRTATDWVYNFICNDEDYNLDAKCDGRYLRIRCVNNQGDETHNYIYYDPDIKIEELKEKGRKNKEEFDKLLKGRLKPKKSKKKKSKKHKKSKRRKKNKKQTKRKGGGHYLVGGKKRGREDDRYGGNQCTKHRWVLCPWPTRLCSEPSYMREECGEF